MRSPRMSMRSSGTGRVNATTSARMDPTEADPATPPTRAPHSRYPRGCHPGSLGHTSNGRRGYGRQDTRAGEQLRADSAVSTRADDAALLKGTTAAHWLRSSRRRPLP